MSSCLLHKALSFIAEKANCKVQPVNSNLTVQHYSICCPDQNQIKTLHLPLESLAQTLTLKKGRLVGKRRGKGRPTPAILIIVIIQLLCRISYHVRFNSKHVKSCRVRFLILFFETFRSQNINLTNAESNSNTSGVAKSNFSTNRIKRACIHRR